MKNPRAFSFVEVMVATFVLAMGILPTFYVFSRGNVGTILNQEEITARQYAGELLDYLHARDYQQVAETSERTLFPLVPGSSELDHRFRRYLTVKKLVPARGIADWPMEYKVLTVEVEWQSGSLDRIMVQTGLLFQGRR